MSEVVEYLHTLDGEIARLKKLVAANGIPGFLTLAEGYALYSLAQTWPVEGGVVEVGSFKGRSTAFLGLGCQTAGRGKVYAVDHFQGSPEHQKGGHEETREIVESGSTYCAFAANIAALGLEGVVEAVVGDSRGASAGWSRTIRLLFIDGDHSYQGTKSDFDLWRPHLGQNGLVCFHDYQNQWYLDGVTRFVDEVVARDPGMMFLHRVESLVVFMTRESPPHLHGADAPQA